MKKSKKAKVHMNPEKANYLLASTSAKMTFRDLKRQAVILGMPFPDVSTAGIFGLMRYIDTAKTTPDPTLIDKYDLWVSKIFNERGIPIDDPIRSNRLRLGFIGDEIDPETGEIKQRSRRVPGLKKPKKTKKRELDETGHVKGTKKQYTWQLAQKGFDLERTKRRVLKKFPDANEKSISLWYRNAKRELNKQQK